MSFFVPDYVCDVLSDFQRFLLCKEILEYNYRGIPYIEEENPYFGSCIEKFVILPSGGKTYKLQPCHGGGPKFNTRTTLLMLYLSSGPQTIIYDTPDELENLTTIPENTFGILYYQDMTTEHHAKGYETVPISYKFGNNRIIERIGKQIPSGRLITSISRQP